MTEIIRVRRQKESLEKIIPPRMDYSTAMEIYHEFNLAQRRPQGRVKPHPTLDQIDKGMYNHGGYRK